MNTQTRMVDRLGAHTRTGDYAYAVQQFKRRIPASEIALYIVGAVGFVTALVFNNFH